MHAAGFLCKKEQTNFLAGESSQECKKKGERAANRANFFSLGTQNPVVVHLLEEMTCSTHSAHPKILPTQLLAESFTAGSQHAVLFLHIEGKRDNQDLDPEG